MTKSPCANMQNLFSPAIDNRLEPGEKMMFDHHLKSCSECQAELAQFERLFSAVAMISNSTMTGPAPYPDSVKSFRHAQPKLPWWGRFGSTAAAAALLVVVGFSAFQAGKKEQPTETAGEETAEFVQPSAPISRQLKSFYYDMEATPVLLDVAETQPGPGAARIVSAFAEDRAKQCQRILTCDDTSLGSKEREYKAVLGDVRVIYARLSHDLKKGRNPAQALRTARVFWGEDANVARRKGELSQMVRSFSAGQNPERYVVSKNPLVKGFSAAVNNYVRGNVEAGLHDLRSVKRHLLNEGRDVHQFFVATENRLKVAPRPAGRFIIGDKGQGDVIFMYTDREKRGPKDMIEITIKGSPNGARSGFRFSQTVRQKKGQKEAIHWAVPAPTKKTLAVPTPLKLRKLKPLKKRSRVL